jgi:hypothetical protein
LDQYSVVLDDSSDTTKLHDNLFESSRHAYEQPKTPKKVEYWYFLKQESLLREQIDLLKSRVESLEKENKQLRETDQDIRTVVQTSESTPQPVGKRANVARSLAEMEMKEKQEYWKQEIKRREEEDAKRSNEGKNQEESKGSEPIAH